MIITMVILTLPLIFFQSWLYTHSLLLTIVYLMAMGPSKVSIHMAMSLITLKTTEEDIYVKSPLGSL